MYKYLIVLSLFLVGCKESVVKISVPNQESNVKVLFIYVIRLYAFRKYV